MTCGPTSTGRCATALSRRADEPSEMIANGMASALFACVWADWADLNGIRYRDVMASMPNVTPDYRDLGMILFGEMLGLNLRRPGTNWCSTHCITRAAAQADGHGRMVETEFSHFGFCYAMQALGHGISWFDEHGKFDLVFPFCTEQPEPPLNIHHGMYARRKVKYVDVRGEDGPLFTGVMLARLSHKEVVNRLVRRGIISRSAQIVTA